MEAHRNIVGPQVMRIRSNKGMSQNDLAVACQLCGWDVSRGVVARIEGGVRWIADFELIELAKALKVSIPELYPADAEKYFSKR
jgi:transcriptional regulator with XRE-family HTH domain